MPAPHYPLTPEFSVIGRPAHPRRYSVKRKPDKFAEFAANVLPHEVAWVQEVQQFQDADNREILETLAYNCHYPRTLVAFRPSIDKRKYPT